jgi:hypothetical protein
MTNEKTSPFHMTTKENKAPKKQNKTNNQKKPALHSSLSAMDDGCDFNL